MNRNWVYSLFALWIVCSFACTQPKPVANVDVQKENFVFSIKGTDTLSFYIARLKKACDDFCFWRWV